MRYHDGGYETLIPVAETAADVTMIRSAIQAATSHWRLSMRDAEGRVLYAMLGPLGVRRGHADDADGWQYSAEIRQAHQVDPARPGLPPRGNEYSDEARRPAEIRLVLSGESDRRTMTVEIRVTSIAGVVETRFVKLDGSEVGYPPPVRIEHHFELADVARARVDAEHRAAHERGREAGIFAD